MTDEKGALLLHGGMEAAYLYDSALSEFELFVVFFVPPKILETSGGKDVHPRAVDSLSGGSERSQIIRRTRHSPTMLGQRATRSAQR